MDAFRYAVPRRRLKKPRAPFGASGLAYGAAVLTAALCLVPGEGRAGRFLPEVDNPYCGIKTYKLSQVPEQASSMTSRQGRPVIVINGMILRDRPHYSQFLLAHECCHHTLGHIKSPKKEFGHVGPKTFYNVIPDLRRLELEADCCAVKLLRERNEYSGIRSASAAMGEFGDKPTGAYYPTGKERSENIVRCATEDE